MSAFCNAVLGCLLAGALALPAGAAPFPSTLSMQKNPAVVDAQVQCDARGCFGFGPQQWHRRSYVQPNYRPPGSPSLYYQPRTANPPPTYYAPKLVEPLPPPAARSPAAAGRHVQWCKSRYRSYNPETNRYVTYRGTYATCRSPQL